MEVGEALQSASHRQGDERAGDDLIEDALYGSSSHPSIPS
jgi:hypothetical protein